MRERKELPKTISHPAAGVIMLKTYSRSKRLRLSFRAPNLFTLTIPPGTTELKVHRFIEETESWILKQVSWVREFVPEVQDQLLFQGIPHQIIQRSLAKRELYQISSQERLIVLDPVGPSISQRLTYLCRREFQKKLPEIINQRSHSMGLFPVQVSIRDTKSRWGSCTSAGHISLSWRLIMAPVEVMEYVIIHELAHLQHMNHSDAFWRLVAHHCPDFKQHRQWLKVNGRLLHAT